jgi:hypothetical protein
LHPPGDAIADKFDDRLITIRIKDGKPIDMKVDVAVHQAKLGIL